MVAPAACTVGIVGLGLIGGSVARGLRQAGFAQRVVAWDRDAQALEAGLQLQVIDAAASDLSELMAAVDIAILATPTLASEPLLLAMLRQPGAARVISDVASVKGSLCRAVAELSPAQRARYVPGHPIAGSERSGVVAARGDLFAAHRVILTPLADTDEAAVEQVAALWSALGAQVSHMSVEDHDAVLAATSHLPHLLAYALVDALANSSTRDDIFRYAAGGFRDFTRIASSDPTMWRDIALANRDALLVALDGFTAHLATLRRAVDEGDGALLAQRFKAAKTARDEFVSSRDGDRLNPAVPDSRDSDGMP